MAKEDDLPDIPSWEELGISKEELAELEKELAESGEAEPEEDLLAGIDMGPAAAGAAPAAGPDKAAPTPSSTPKPASKAKAPGGPKKAAGEDPAPKDSAPKVATPEASTPRAKGEGFFARIRKRSKKQKDTKGAGATASGGTPPPSSGADTTATLPPAPRWRGPLTLALLALLSWGASWNRVSPRPAPETAPDSVFSADRAFAHLDQVARAAHPPGSPEHRRVREYLVDQLRALGLDPQVQTTTTVLARGLRADAATVRNVIARIPGSSSTGAVLITAHYDGREISFGAGDDGAGVVTVLESIRALSTGTQLANDVIVLITDAEEVGLLGARAFVDQHPWINDVQVVLSVEMRGAGGPSIMFETGQENGWVIQEYAAATPAAATNSLSAEVYKRLPNDTDFSPFRDIGKQGLNFAAIGRAHIYHQQYDNAENLSRRTVQHHGVQALAMLRHFGNADLSGSLQAPDRVYFGIPFLGVVTYAAWVPPAVGVFLLLMLGIVVMLARRSGARIGGMGIGAAAALLVVGAGIGIGWALGGWVPRFHPEVGALHGSAFHSEGWYVLTLVAATTAFAFALLPLLRRRFTIGELAVGATVVPALAAVASGFLLPFAAMNLQWPALAAMIGSAIVAGVGRTERVGWVGWGALVVLSIPVLVFMSPLIELLWLAMSISLAPVLGGLAGLTLLMLLPLVDVGREPNGWAASAGMVVLSAVLLGIGLLMARPSASRPAPTTLIYLADRESGESFWATDASLVSEDVDRTDPAVAWAIEKAGAPEETRSLESFIAANYTVATSPAPRASIPAVAVGMALPAADSTMGASPPTGEATVRVHSTVGAERLQFLLPENGLRIRAINGQPLSNSSEAQVVTHWGEPMGAVELDVVLPASGPASFTVVEHHFRPDELVGAEAFSRPAELAPNINRLSDRAIIRTAVLLDPLTGTVTFTAREPVAATAPSEDLAVSADSAASGGEFADSTNQQGDSLAAAPIPAAPAQIAGDGGPLGVALFARDRVSSVAPEFAITFAPDGRTAYFNRTSPDRSEFSLLATILTGSGWSAPEPVPFASDGRDIDPFVTPEGDRIYFSSDRERPGTPAGEFSVWYVDRTPTGWSEPIDAGAPLNSDSSDVFISVARDGTTVFSSWRDGARKIYETRQTASGWAVPTLVRFGSVEAAGNPLIAPDGRVMIFAMDGPFGDSDLFMSCREASGGWGAPRVLPEPINSAFAEFAPAFHPDGTLLFTSERPGILGPVPEGVRPPGDIYQTSGPVSLSCS